MVIQLVVKVEPGESFGNKILGRRLYDCNVLFPVSIQPGIVCR